MIILTKETIILGIDPGTNYLGFGLIVVKLGKAFLLDYGIIDVHKESEHFVKLAMISREIAQIMDRFSPDYLAIESAFYAKDPQVIQKLGRVQGIVISEAIKRCITVAEYAPRKAKIAVTGNGSASKEQVCTMVCKQLGIDITPKHLDSTDALAIALCHYYESKSPIPSLKGKNSWKQFMNSNPDRIVDLSCKKKEK